MMYVKAQVEVICRSRGSCFLRGVSPRVPLDIYILLNYYQYVPFRMPCSVARMHNYSTHLIIYDLDRSTFQLITSSDIM